MDKYFATLPPEELHSKLLEKNDSYYDHVQTNYLSLWRSSYRAYYAANFNSGTMTIEGMNGEKIKIEVNQYKNLVDHSITIALNQLPSWRCRATNGDTKSMKQCIVGNDVLDYKMREEKVQENILRQALLAGSLYGEGFVATTWDAKSGKVYKTDPVTGIKIFEGDVKYAVFAPIDVIRDPNLYSSMQNQWYILREFRNKYDLAAKFANTDDETINNTIKDGIDSNTRPDTNRYIWLNQTDKAKETDIIEVFTFYHARTDACPKGRKTVFTEGVILSDGPLPTEQLQVRRLAPGNLDFTPFGYTCNFDLLSLQQCLNILYSIIITNQEANGVSCIVAEQGAVPGVAELVGRALITVPPGAKMPAALNFTQTPPEIFNFIKMLENVMETLTGVSSVVRGNPEASLKSGAALALVQSMAVQFMMGLQASYISLLEDVGTDTINLLKTYASVPRMAAIVGKGKKSMMRAFSSQDLTEINRVQVDAGNPMTRTAAGKAELAATLIQNKLITTPDEYLMVIETGNLDPLTLGKTNILIWIQEENERLADGVETRVMYTDAHIDHIKSHTAYLSDPAVREDAALVEMFSKHIQEHIMQAQSPEYQAYYAMMNGQVPQPQAVQQGAVPGGPPGESANDIAEGMLPNQPNMPSLPPGANVPH